LVTGVPFDSAAPVGIALRPDPNRRPEVRTRASYQASLSAASGRDSATRLRQK